MAIEHADEEGGGVARSSRRTHDERILREVRMARDVWRGKSKTQEKSEDEPGLFLEPIVHLLVRCDV